jgi:anti-sigma factor ChrR (cupin superfamily)
VTSKAHNTLKELALYAMQGLTVEESAAVSTHLQICLACRTDHAQVGVDLALKGLVVQQRELPLGARERLMERVAGSALRKPQDTLAKTTIKKSLLSMRAPASMAATNKPNTKGKISTAMPARSRVAAARIVNIF